jgi:hypothetical protein
MTTFSAHWGQPKRRESIMRAQPSPELRAANAFAQATADVRALASASGDQRVKRIVYSTLDSLQLFGVSDAHRRKAERSRATGFGTEAQGLASRLNERYNDAGLRTLRSTREEFRMFAQEHPGSGALLAGDSEDMLESFRAELVELDLHDNETTQLDSYFTRVVETAQSAGPSGLAQLAESAIQELDEARRRPDRGGNPWWKGVGFLIGAAAIFTYYTACQDPNLACPEWLKVLIVLVGLAGAIMALLC